MHPPLPPRTRRQPRGLPAVARHAARSGAFVLVSTLLLVGLATVLVVTVSMMARVEQKAAANTAKLEQARANALFALDVAVNQLQREAGPDQRITARAEILDTNSTTLNTTAVKQPLWTGVWRSGTNHLDAGASPQRAESLGAANPTTANKIAAAKWLVSGGGTLDPGAFAGTTNSPNAQAALMARYQATNASAIDVLAPLVPMLSGTNTNGAYAYWVSDEGVKAKVNQTDPTLGANPASDASRSQLHFFSAQAAAAHKGSTNFGATDLRANTNLTKITTLQSMANLDGLAALAGTNAAKIGTDFTTASWGVLADARRGGLKKDLTAALESPAAFTNLASTYGHGAQMLYRSATDAGLTVPPVDTGQIPPTDGLLWHSLFFFYNSYKSVMPAPVTTSGTPSPAAPTGSGNAAAQPQVVSPRVYCLSRQILGSPSFSTKLSGLVPVPIAYRVDVALSSYQSGGQYKLRVHYFPQLVLWNPYGVRLQFSNYQFQREIEAFKTGTPTISGKVGGTDLPAIAINQAPNANKRLLLATAPGNCDSLEPGETRVFALDADAAKPDLPGAITFSALVSNPGMSADFSQYADWAGYAGTANGTDTLSISISDRRLRGQAADTFVEPSSLKWPHNDGSNSPANYNPNVRYQAGPSWDIAAANSNWDSTLRIQDLENAPRRIIGFYIRLKGLLASSSTYSYSNGNSLPPLFMGNAAPVSPFDDSFSYAWQEVYLSPLGTLYQNGQTDVQIAPSGSFWQTSVGAESAGAGFSSTRCILRDVPNQPLVSLGQFMHMPASNFRSFGIYEMFLPGTMFVGGSCASPVMDATATARSIGLGTSTGGAANNKLFLDDSFLANEALFDRFFFSTVPPGGANSPDTWANFNAANAGATLSDSSKPLLNSRMKPYFKNKSVPAMTDLRNVDKAAANLMLDGAFNINSTSVAAWKALLGGLSGNNSLALWNGTTGSTATVPAGSGTLVSRFWSASGLTAANQPWSGVRILSDTELNDLATRIVEDVKTRGPFLSMGDFLNRRLGPADSLTRCGTIQAAIDKTPLNTAAKAAGAVVNATAPAEANRVPNLIAANMKDASGDTWSTALGIPGYLMQQDIIQAIAPALAARSDSFLVRSYGEVRNPRTGEVEGRAWAEAVVQRLPDLADDSQPAEIAQASMNATNQALGRRFKVVSFRWLNPNEV